MYEGLETDWNKLQTKWNVVKEIADKVPVDDDFIYEEFDIPKPENYEAMKEEMRQEKAMQFMGMGGFVDDRISGQEQPKDKPKNFLGRIVNFFA